MALAKVPALQFKSCDMFGFRLGPPHFLATQNARFIVRPLVVQAKGKPRTDSAKIRNRRMRKKYNGTQRKPRLSVFCSDKQLYAMLVDDQNKKTLFYGSTLLRSIRDDPPCGTIEAARRLGEKLIEACVELNINEISSYDRNGFARGERMQAFDIAIGEYGFLPR